jgi:hypothetical protein
MKRETVVVLFLTMLPLMVLPLSTAVQAAAVSVNVGSGAVGVAKNGALIVAEKGSVVYARKGSNVQYWPGSTLVPAASGAALPDCSKSSVIADGSGKELFVKNGAEACTVGDVAVIAQEGSTVIYDDDVPLIRRPVNRR